MTAAGADANIDPAGTKMIRRASNERQEDVFRRPPCFVLCHKIMELEQVIFIDSFRIITEIIRKFANITALWYNKFIC